MNESDFTVLWYSGGPEHAPNRVIARDPIRAGNVEGAVAQACTMLVVGNGSHDRLARGFYVRRSTQDDLEIFAERKNS